MNRAPWLSTFFPFLRWFPLPAGALRTESVAGLTVALVLIPQSMAYAELAGLPPLVGLYASFLPPIVASLWGSSANLQTGPVAMASLLTATTLAGFAAPGTDEYLRLAVYLAFLVGVALLLLAALKLTFIVNFISRPVIDGFLHAGVLIIATSQLGTLLGLKMPRGEHYVLDLADLAVRIGQTHGPTLAVGASSLAFLTLAAWRFPRLPAGLIAVVVSTLVVRWLGLSAAGGTRGAVAIVGALPSGLPHPVMAVPDAGQALRLLPGAGMIAFVSFMETCSIAKALAARTRHRLDIPQETIGQGLASLAAAFSGGYPVTGSFSRSALDYICGSRTGLSEVFAGTLVMVFLIFCTEALHFMPKAVLGAIIVAAVVRLMDPRRFAQCWRISRADGVVSVLTFVATLAVAPHMERGIVFGVVLSLAIHLYRTMKPRVVLVGVRGDGELREAARYGLPVDPAMPILRFDGSLYFANASYFEESVLNAAAAYPLARHVSVCCEGITALDASGGQMLAGLAERLREQNVAVVLFDVKKQVYDRMERGGIVDALGREHVVRTLAEAREHAGA